MMEIHFVKFLYNHQFFFYLLQNDGLREGNTCALF